MKKFAFLLSALMFGLHASEITLNKYDVHDVAAICAIEPTLKAVYLTAFEQVYKDHWTESFAQSFIDYFDNHFKKLKQSDNILLIVAKKNDRVAGWTLFLCREQLAIIDMICVDPEFQQQGVGKALVFSIKEYAPGIRSVAVVTKKINTVSPLFYERLGFIKTNFLHADYKAEEVQGYELAIDVNPLVEIFKDYRNRTIELRHLHDDQLFAQAAPIFTNSLLKAYAHISAEDLKLDKNFTLKERLDNYFQQEELAQFIAMGAFFENHLVGYISFDAPSESGELYIRQLAVDTYYWQSGIGRKLGSIDI